MWMSSSGTIKTMCYDWASWTVKGIDFHLPPIKSSDIWHAFASTLPTPPFCFLLKYSAVPLASVLLLPPCQNTLNLIYLFSFKMCVYVCVHYALFVHNSLTAELKSSNIMWCDSMIVLPLSVPVWFHVPAFMLRLRLWVSWQVVVRVRVHIL